MKTKNFWANSLEAIEKTVQNVKLGSHRVMAKSQGGRDIHILEYGEKQDFNRRANYNSALYYRDTSVYADKRGKKPVVLIVGATHGGELEGITGILNLVNGLENGNSPEDMRLLIIPCLNPDGRARVPFEIVPTDPAETIYYKQGQWLDGTPACYVTGMRVHPIIDAVSHMGGYYNDAGVNMYADNYFSPMAPETAALFKLVDEEAPDLVLLLHTGCHKHGKILQPYYMPGFINECAMEFDDKLCRAFENSGYTYYSQVEHGPADVRDSIWPPVRFPMETAVTFSCGALCVVYESREAVEDPDNPFYLDNMLDCHKILFEQAFMYAREYQKKCLEATACKRGY